MSPRRRWPRPMPLAARLSAAAAGGAGADLVQFRARRPGQEAGADRRRQQPAGSHPQSVRRETRRPAMPRSWRASRTTAAKLRDGGRRCGKIRRRPMPARLAAAWRRWRNGPAANRARATEAVVPGLKTMLRQLSDALTPSRVTLATMPAAMKRGMDRRRRHRPHPGLSQGHQQRSRARCRLSAMRC